MAEATSSDLRVPAPRREHVPLGILFMVGATILFAASSAISKWLVEPYPAGEVLFTRTLVSLITCAIFILPKTGLAAIARSAGITTSPGLSLRVYRRPP